MEVHLHRNLLADQGKNVRARVQESNPRKDNRRNDEVRANKVLQVGIRRRRTIVRQNQKDKKCRRKTHQSIVHLC